MSNITPHKINLQEPFKSKWKWGYTRTNPDGRVSITLYNSDNDRKTISYARYLMGIHLGYEVPDEYEVDHINNDKTDDRIENFQLLTRSDNIKKRHEYYRNEIQEKQNLICNYCNREFKIPVYEYKRSLQRNCKNFYCSKKCEHSYHESNRHVFNCSNCKKEFTISPAKYKNITKTKQKNIFCNRNCYFEFTENNKIYHKYNCIHCEKEFTLSNSEKIQKDKKGIKISFCSTECLVTHSKEKASVYLNCPVCDKEFRITKARYNYSIKRNIKYICCSISCRNKFRFFGGDKEIDKKLNCDTCSIQIERDKIKYVLHDKIKNIYKHFCSKNCFNNAVNFNQV